MRYFIGRFRRLIVLTGLFLIGVSVRGQVALLQHTIDKVDGYKNLSYHRAGRLQEIFTNDTVTNDYQEAFVKTPDDKAFGYLFTISAGHAGDSLFETDVYDGGHLTRLKPHDSTYEMQQAQAFNFQATLPGCLKWIKQRLAIPSSSVVQLRDTTIDAQACYHLVADVFDTVIDKERNYTLVHVFVDQRSGVPDCIIIKLRNSTYGNGITHYYSESHYSGYTFDNTGDAAGVLKIPAGFHAPKEQPGFASGPVNRLAVGSVAPDWTLSDPEGTPVSLSALKGKVVMLDFFFIGCGGCMLSLNTLDSVYERYAGKDFALCSLTYRDNAKAVTAFKKDYHIGYPIYIGAQPVVNAYHVGAFPTFYFIDKEGRVADIVVGYNEELGKRVCAIIDRLLAK